MIADWARLRVELSLFAASFDVVVDWLAFDASDHDLDHPTLLVPPTVADLILPTVNNPISAISNQFDQIDDIASSLATDSLRLAVADLQDLCFSTSDPSKAKPIPENRLDGQILLPDVSCSDLNVTQESIPRNFQESYTQLVLESFPSHDSILSDIAVVHSSSNISANSQNAIILDSQDADLEPLPKVTGDTSLLSDIVAGDSLPNSLDFSQSAVIADSQSSEALPGQLESYQEYEDNDVEMSAFNTQELDDRDSDSTVTQSLQRIQVESTDSDPAIQNDFAPNFSEIVSSSDFEMDHDNNVASQSLCFTSQITEQDSLPFLPVPRSTPATGMSISNANQFHPIFSLERLDDIYQSLRNRLIDSFQETQTQPRIIQLEKSSMEKGMLIVSLQKNLETKSELANRLQQEFLQGLMKARDELCWFRQQVLVDLEAAQQTSAAALSQLKTDLSIEKRNHIKSKLQAELNEPFALQAKQVELNELVVQMTLAQSTIAQMRHDMKSQSNQIDQLQAKVDGASYKESELNQLQIQFVELNHRNSDLNAELVQTRSSFDLALAAAVAKQQAAESCSEALKSEIAEMRNRDLSLNDNEPTQSVNELIEAALEGKNLSLANLNVELKAAREALIDSSKKVQAYVKLVEEKDEMIRFNEQELASTNDALKTTSDHAMSVESEIVTLQKKLSDIETETEERIASAQQTTISKLENSHLLVCSEHEQVKLGMEDVIRKLQNELDDAKTLLMTQKVEMTRLLEKSGKEYQTIQSENERLVNEYQNKSRAFDGALSEIADLTKQVKSSQDLHVKISELETNLVETTERELALMTELEAMHSKMESTMANFELLQKEKESIVLNHEDLIVKKRDEIESFKTLETSLSKQVAHLQDQIKVQAEKLTEKETHSLEYEKVLKQRDEIQARNSQLIKECVAVKQTVSKLNEDLVKAKEAQIEVSNEKSLKASVIVDVLAENHLVNRKRRALSQARMMSIPESSPNSPRPIQSDGKKLKMSPEESSKAKHAPQKSKKRRESIQLDQIGGEENTPPEHQNVTPIRNVIGSEKTPESSTKKLQTRSSRIHIYIGMSGFKENTAFNGKLRAELATCIKKLPGAKLLNGSEGKDQYNPKLTHIITPPETKTLKTLAATLAGAWVIQDPQWVIESAKANEWLPECKYGYRCESNHFTTQKLYVTPGFDEYKKDEKKQSGQWPGFLRLLWRDCAGGMIVDNADEADYAIRRDSDTKMYGKAKCIDWQQLMAMIPTGAIKDS